MAENWPMKYSHPYVMCTQCGGNNCYGRHCLGPNCDYIERSAFNRFERPPIPLPSSSCVRPPAQTCHGVSSLTYNQGEYINPQVMETVSHCKNAPHGNAFQVSKIRYENL